MSSSLSVAAVRVAALALLLLLWSYGAGATVFTLVNNCSYTVWPGTFSGNGGAVLGDGGFTLAPVHSVPLSAPSGWSGHLWGRTGCSFDGAGKGSCTTGDCGNVLKCDDASGAPPVSLAEFTLGEKDFYDISLVDGYNIPLSIAPVGGIGECRIAGCMSDLKMNCPAELSVTSNGQVIACNSACAAFGTSQYCCTGDHGTPQTCWPTHYTKVFKSSCPTAYSYAYDDPKSTFTCSNADYTITFCPTS